MFLRLCQGALHTCWGTDPTLWWTVYNSALAFTSSLYKGWRSNRGERFGLSQVFSGMCTSLYIPLKVDPNKSFTVIKSKTLTHPQYKFLLNDIDLNLLWIRPSPLANISLPGSEWVMVLCSSEQSSVSTFYRWFKNQNWSKH